MNKTKRRVAYILIGAIICLSASSYTARAESPQSLKINLEQAIEQAAAKSTEMKLIDEKIKNAEKRLSYAVRIADIKKNESWITDAERTDVKTQVELAPIQKRNIVEVLKLQRAEKIKILEMDVTKAYFTYLLTQQQIQYQDNAIRRLEQKLEIVKAQVLSGKASKTVLSSIEVAIKLAEQQKVLLTRDLNNISINLNSLLGRPIKSVLELTKLEIPVPELNINLEELINKKNADSSKILQALNSKTEAKVEYNIVNYSSVKVVPDGIEDAEDKLLNASYDYENLLIETECNVLNEYNNVLNLRDEIDIKKLQVDNNEKELMKAKVEYERGLIDIIKYNSVTQEFENAKIEYEKAKLNYLVGLEILKG